MGPKTVLSTNWIEVHDRGSAYMARVFLTDRDEAYMEAVMDGKRRFFKVDANLLKLGELGFFEKFMERSVELPMEHIGKIRL